MRSASALFRISLTAFIAGACLAQQSGDLLPPPPAAQSAAERAALAEKTAVWLEKIDALIPGMAADEPEQRQQAQREFEQLCFEAGRPRAEQERRALCQAMAARLGPQTPLAARVWMLRQMERLSGEEIVPALAQLLSDENPQVRDTARRALQNNPSPFAAFALTMSLRQPQSDEWQVALVNALAARGKYGNTGLPLFLKLVRSEDPAVASAAIAALGDIGGAESSAALAGVLNEGEADLRDRAADALLQIADALVAAGNRGQAEDIYTRVHQADVAENRRLGAFRGLALARGGSALPMLLDVMGDDAASFELRALAANLAAELPGFAVTVTLASRLPDLPESAQPLAIRALGDRGDASALPAVLSMLASADEQVRLAALHAAGLLGDSSAVWPLAKVAAGEQGALQEAARAGLALLRGAGVDQLIISGLDEASPDVRVELIHALKERWCHEAGAALLKQARSTDTDVCVAAIDALGRLAAPDQAPVMVDILTGAEEERVRSAAEDALVAVCERIEGQDQRVAPVLAARAAPRPEVRAALVRVLGRLEGPAALKSVREALADSDESVSDAAVRALAQWSSPEVLPDLLRLARDSESRTHRVLALRGYVRLVSKPDKRPPAETLALLEEAFQMAERPEEKRLVLAGVAEVMHTDALKFLRRQMNDDAVKAEAEAAVVSSALLVGPLDRELAREALSAVVAGTQTDATRQRARKALGELRKTDGYIASWQVCGPYFEADRDWNYVRDHAFAPEAEGRETVKWRLLEITDREQPWIFDLGSLFEGGDRCVYVRAAVYSPSAQPARLEVGSDDSVKVWLNDRVVHSFDRDRGHTPFQDKVPVTLNSGWNTLMLKVTQIGGGWGFSCAVRNPDGSPPTGLVIRSEHAAGAPPDSR